MKFSEYFSKRGFGITLILCGIFLIAISIIQKVVFAPGLPQKVSDIEFLATQKPTPTPAGRISDTAVSDSRNIIASALPFISGTIEITGHSTNGYEKSLENQANIVQTGKWEATDYTNGEIVSNQYTVQLGDTLWEIAEAHYGSGFGWTDILAKNSSIIGFLPNGEQALIFPGQVLTL